MLNFHFQIITMEISTDSRSFDENGTDSFTVNFQIITEIGIQIFKVQKILKIFHSQIRIR